MQLPIIIPYIAPFSHNTSTTNRQQTDERQLCRRHL